MTCLVAWVVLGALAFLAYPGVQVVGACLGVLQVSYQEEDLVLVLGVRQQTVGEVYQLETMDFGRPVASQRLNHVFLLLNLF